MQSLTNIRSALCPYRTQVKPLGQSHEGLAMNTLALKPSCVATHGPVGAQTNKAHTPKRNTISVLCCLINKIASRDRHTPLSADAQGFQAVRRQLCLAGCLVHHARYNRPLALRQFTRRLLHNTR
jgi:hypothetical protein